MNVPQDDVVYFDVVTHSPATGGVTDADSTPTFEVFEESTDTDIGVGGNLTKRTGKTGNYRGSFTASAANGFELGKWYSIVASATVAAVAGKTVAKIFRIVQAESTAGIPSANVTQISGDSTAADNAEAFFDGTGYAGTNNVIPLVTTTTTATNVTTVNGLAANVITAASIQADAITDAKVAADVTIASVTGSVGSVTGAVGSVTGAVGSVTGNVGGNVVGTVGSVTGNVGGNVTGSVGSIATGGIVSGSFAAGAINNAAMSIDGSELTAVPWNAAWDAEVQSEVQDAIEANHLDHLLAVTYDPASKPGAADALLNELVESDAGVARYTANALEQAPTGGLAPTASQIADEVQTRTIAGVTLVTTTTNLTNLPTIPANWLTAAGTAADFTTEIQSGLATAVNLATVAGYLDTEIAAILEDTGTTIPAQIAALNNLSPAQVNAEVDTALADYDGPTNAEMVARTLAAAAYATAAAQSTAQTSLDDIPTNAELATALGTADDAVLAAIAGLNDITAASVWSAGTRVLTAGTNIVLAKGTGVTGFTDIDAAGVRTAVGLASANLDTQLDAIPTNAELATALATADDAVLAAVATLQTYVDTEVAAIKAKTDNLPTDPADASDIAASFASIAASIATLQTYVDTEVAAIKAKTDSLTFTVAGQVDSNVHYVNDTQVTGNGETGTEWGPV